MKSGKKQPVLASANQFTPMTQKNGVVAGTPINPLRLSDLETPKSNKKSNTSSQEKNLLDEELNTPKVQPDLDSDDDIFAIRQCVVETLERIDRYIMKHNLKPNELLPDRRAAIQNPPTPIISHELNQNIEQVKQPEPILKKRVELVPEAQKVARREKSKQIVLEKEPTHDAKRIKNRRRSSKSSSSELNDVNLMDLSPRISNEVNEPAKPVRREKSRQIANDPEPERKISKARRPSSKDSSSESTEVKSTSISPRQSTNSLSGSFSTDGEGKSLQERMHQMSIILRNLEMHLDDIAAGQ
ncbi:hypothetical protein TVAG_074580 [Trichomonas vaginalis G3]|uniref:Uncharacterized protein n=1 Tax=Trichomonas vaginalis (strain ATCC PRA-98 / G3) TaxID=412133 RepID=A2E3X5_TRIV3|nr:hypothetical protein TVAGG3_0146970 [Trichomonas vaginalis G3]EAY12630.1 hypothetical protein TVAG_074580 [Trichomonas vaginalis G3]KAI5546991.1 hypothetical protein TVAGG3_0146970 [Trichomonas vaginalis G3]|eukprot:XP_001324853.1 hypothetical protein [Trichomonas vaginalis G3]